MKTIYTISAPDFLGAMIKVYGEPENAWYEWRIIDGGRHPARKATAPFRGGSTGKRRLPYAMRSCSRLACPSGAGSF